MSHIRIPVSAGELIDKITILEIKDERIKAREKLQNIRLELDLLKGVWRDSRHGKVDISTQWKELKKINETLWDIEDQIRLKESRNEFDDDFIQLARSVYISNDKRAALKQEINRLLGSELIEEKSYADYTHRG